MTTTISSDEDPFYAVKEDIIKTLQQAQTQFSALTTSSTAATPQNINAVTTLLQTLDLDLGDLEETIKVVESNPYKYKLDFTEVKNRKQWVEATRKEMEKLSSGLRVLSKGNKQGQDRDMLFAQTAQQNTTSVTTTVPSYNLPERSRFVEREMQQQTMIMQQQDQQLDGVLDTMYNLKDIAQTMGRELEDQTGLLEDMEMGVDNTAGRLGVAQKKMNEVIKAAKADAKSTLCIFFLIIILIVLLVLIIYT